MATRVGLAKFWVTPFDCLTPKTPSLVQTAVMYLQPCLSYSFSKLPYGVMQFFAFGWKIGKLALFIIENPSRGFAADWTEIQIVTFSGGLKMQDRKRRDQKRTIVGKWTWLENGGQDLGSSQEVENAGPENGGTNLGLVRVFIRRPFRITDAAAIGRTDEFWGCYEKQWVTMMGRELTPGDCSRRVVHWQQTIGHRTSFWSMERPVSSCPMTI